MKRRFFAGWIGIAVWLWTASLSAAPITEVMLWKKDPFLYGACEPCTDQVTLDEGENRARLDLRNFETQTGYFVATLKGPAGTTVTLFGDREFATGAGFLIVTKRDDRAIRLENLEAFPGKRWVEVEPAEGWGAYSVWYQPHAGFKHGINSLRWGTWWSRLPID